MENILGEFLNEMRNMQLYTEDYYGSSTSKDIILCLLGVQKKEIIDYTVDLLYLWEICSRPAEDT